MPLRDQKFTPGVCDPNLAADVVFTVGKRFAALDGPVLKTLFLS